MPIGLGRIVGADQVTKPLMLGSQALSTGSGGINNYYNFLQTNVGNVWTQTFRELVLTAVEPGQQYFSLAAVRVGDVVFGTTGAETNNPIPTDPFRTPFTTIRMGKRSTDKGVTWTDIIIDNYDVGGGATEQTRWLAAAANPAGVMVALGSDGGGVFSNGTARPPSVIYYSHDIGETWTRTTDFDLPPGATDDGRNPITSVVWAEELGAFFATIHDGFANAGSGTTAILRSTDGVSWSSVYSKASDNVGGNINNYRLTGIGWNGSRLVAWGVETYIPSPGITITPYDLWATSDDGETWTLRRNYPSGGSTTRVHDWAKVVGRKNGTWVVAANGTYLNAGSGNGNGRYAVLRSTDNGVTWTQQSTGIGVIDLAVTSKKFYRTVGEARFQFVSPVVSRRIDSSTRGDTWSTDTNPYGSSFRPTALATYVKPED